MAIVNPITQKIDNDFATRGAVVVTWSGLNTTDDEGAPVSLVEYADRSVQVAGTLGGATVNIEGSNDGDAWAVLTDPKGDPIGADDLGIFAVGPMTRYIRPKIEGGSEQDVNVVLFAKTVIRA